MAEIVEEKITLVDRLRIDRWTPREEAHWRRLGREAADEIERLTEALKIARRYVDAVVFNTPDPKKRRNYNECLAIIDEALKIHQGGGGHG